MTDPMLAEQHRYQTPAHLAWGGLVNDMFQIALAGATDRELADAARAVGVDEHTASALATRVTEEFRRMTAAADRSKEIIADAIAGYPANTWATPEIVDAAPFASRPSFWTREAA